MPALANGGGEKKGKRVAKEMALSVERDRASIEIHSISTPTPENMFNPLQPVIRSDISHYSVSGASSIAAGFVPWNGVGVRAYIGPRRGIRG